MNSDAKWLRQYVEERSESAFAELLREHLNMVYSAALREASGDRALAEDLSQAVFTELARKAHRLLNHPSLAGWLYTAVRHKAANARRADHQRRRREEEAQRMDQLLSQETPDEVWRQLRPVLDDALHELKETDRAVLVLRFLEDRPLREVGESLGLSENAARMRAERALEKLRGCLAQRGITSTASGLVAAVATGVLTPAPPALAAAIAAAAPASGAVAGSFTLSLIKLMSMTSVKMGLVGALVVATVGVPAWQQTRVRKLESENTQLRAQKEELDALRDEVKRLRTVGVSQDELEGLRQWRKQTEPELLRLRGLAGSARQATTEAAALRAQIARQAGAATAAPAGTTPDTGPTGDLIKQALEQQVEGQLSRLDESLHLTAEQTQSARGILLRQAGAMATGMQQVFSGKFDKDALTQVGKDAGDPDTQIQALLTPEQKAAFPEYKKQENAYTAGLSANQELLQMESTLGLTADQVNKAYAALTDLASAQLNGQAKSPASTNPADVMAWMSEQKVKAMETVLTPGQLDSYRQQQAAQVKASKEIWTRMQGGGGADGSK